MSLTSFSLRELLQNGVHFGHKSARRNPNMVPYVYGERNGISIIDLAKTKFLLRNALDEIKGFSSRNGRILFVGTKDQASACIEETARSCSQFFINHRWLGGTLTNWNTVSSSIKTLENLEKRLEVDGPKLTKKEYVDLEAKVIKLRRVLDGIRDMSRLPHMLFVVDAQKEKLAVLEAKKLGIPVVAMVDTNTDPAGIDYIIPANDDSKSSIQLICRLVQGAVLEGLQEYYEKQKVIEATAEKEKVAEARASDAKPEVKPMIKSTDTALSPKPVKPAVKAKPGASGAKSVTKLGVGAKVDTTKVAAKVAAKVDTTKVAAKVDTTKVAAKVDTTKVDAKVDTTKVDAKVDTTKVEASKVNTPKMDISKIDISKIPKTDTTVVPKKEVTAEKKTYKASESNKLE